MSDGLRAQVLRALKWSASLKLVSQLITWGMTFIVIRLLEPADYGLMAIATIAIAFAMLVNELGVGPAIIQTPEIDDRLLRQAFGILIAMNGILCAGLWLVAPLLAEFFEEPSVTEILRVLCLQFVFVSFTVIPESLLIRNLDFKRKSIVELITNITGGTATLVLALNGFGVWSLVLGNLIFVALRGVAMNVANPFFRLPLFSLSGARGLLTFGGLITIDRLLWFFYSRADVFIVGKILGTELLGIYSVAMQIASLPMQKLNGIINEIAFPAFSKVQHDAEQIRNYLSKAIRLLSLFAFPVFLGISSVSTEFVSIVLGEQWAMAALPLAVLSCIMPLRMISNVITSTLQGIGRVGVSVGNLVIASIIIPLAIAIGTRWSLVGVSMAWLMAFPLVTAIEIVRARRFTGIGVGDFISLIWRPLLNSLVMWLAVAAFAAVVGDRLPELLQMIAMVLVGAVTYLAMLWFLDRRSLDEALSLARS